MYSNELMLVKNPASTRLLTEPPSAIGLAATPRLVNVTLSLTPGMPVGDQLPPVDQRVSPAKPFHAIGAPEAEDAGLSTPATRVTIMKRCCRGFIQEAPETAFRSWVDGDCSEFSAAGCKTILSVGVFMWFFFLLVAQGTFALSLQSWSAHLRATDHKPVAADDGSWRMVKLMLPVCKYFFFGYGELENLPCRD